MPAPFKNTGIDADEVDVDLLRELEKQSVKEISRLRSSQRIDLKVEVLLEPGDSSRRSGGGVRGETMDISKGGLRAVFPQPVGVGDVYRLSFEDAGFALPLLFARCLRCALVREDAFDCGFKFFSPLVIPELEGKSGDLLS